MSRMQTIDFSCGKRISSACVVRASKRGVRAIPFTVNRLYSVQGTGTNAGLWGAGTVNSLNEGVMEILDSNLGGITALSLASTTPIALTQTQCNNGLLRMTGVLLASIVVGPDTGVTMSGFFFFENLTTGSFTVTFTNTGGSVVLPQGRRGVLWIDTTYGPRVLSSVGSSQTDIIPAGSVQPFYNTSAPTGWTIVALNDYALKIVSATGGVTSGTVDYSALFGRTATDSYTLQIADMPAHTHTFSGNNAPTGGAGSGGGGGSTTTSSTGGGGGHTHAIDMRVKTASIILATRN